MRIDRRAYADMYGPTTGDRVRLGDTDLVVEVEKDHTVYGEECKFGGGKVLRDGMGAAEWRESKRGTGLGNYQCAGARLHRHLQGRHRRQGRAHRRDWQGWQPRYYAGCCRANDRRRDY